MTPSGHFAFGCGGVVSSQTNTGNAGHHNTTTKSRYSVSFSPFNYCVNAVLPLEKKGAYPESLYVVFCHIK